MFLTVPYVQSIQSVEEAGDMVFTIRVVVSKAFVAKSEDPNSLAYDILLAIHRRFQELTNPSQLDDEIELFEKGTTK